MFWLNEHWRPLHEFQHASPHGLRGVREAQHKLERFAGLLMKVFPELHESQGRIESALHPADVLRDRMLRRGRPAGRWLIKGDHALPVAGSIKARGGIYEVLVHAEELALRSGCIGPDDDRALLAAAPARELFARHEVSVGSTGNLGLSIGVTAAALGFKASVHMSAEAKEWKKARLRARGVRVIEHVGDYCSAVAAGREQAKEDPNTYFVDDESSERLFFGYSVAALRLQEQLASRAIAVDARHPLFVYLPCGVGGAPGGIAFALRHVFGDHVHCFFAEPVTAPCMLLRLASRDDRPVSVADVGLDGQTEADGLAVTRASEFVAPIIKPVVSGLYTVPDSDLLATLYLMKETLGLEIEPSAAAGLLGPRWLLDSAPGKEYLRQQGLTEHMDGATHVLWTTGGSLVPRDEYEKFLERGRREWELRQETFYDSGS